MACQIKRNSNGTIAQVLAPNGKDSMLYQDLVANLSNPQMMAMVTQDPYVNMVLGTEYVKDTSVEEVALAAWSKAYTADFIEQFGNWKVKVIANTDVNGEPVVGMLFPNVETSSLSTGIFDKQLAQKIQNKLQQLYPEIKLNITNNPVWEQGDNILNQQQYDLEVNYRLKATKVILDNYDKIKSWETNKSITKDVLYKKIGELGIPKQQLDLLKKSEGNTIEEKLASFIATYSYTVKINTAKTKTENIKQVNATYFEVDGMDYTAAFGSWFKDEGTIKISYDEYKKALDKYNQQNIQEKPTQYYSDLTVPGGTNYTENEIATPAITPFIKGHAQFATDKGIGWFRSDEQRVGGKTATEMGADDFIEGDNGQRINPDNITIGGKDTKTRRILEVQSDLFQKGRDMDFLVDDLRSKSPNDLQEIYGGGQEGLEEYQNDIKDLETKGVNKSENQFLQLLNKDNNWVTFFVKSIIQDSAKKGYEKVLFPTGNTASKVEGHTTLEEFKKQKEDRIKELEESKTKDKYSFTDEYGQTHTVKTDLEKINNEINQLKQELERVERGGFSALRPIYNFYENTVASILKKQGYNPIQVTDEYGNTWNQVTVNQARDLSEILLQRDKANKIIGQANIKAMTVLIDAVNQKQDTLPHEYAHHYISWYRNTPIVQEAIKKWGSEEALVQAIGEQVVKQKGEAYNWWQKFVKWILDKFNSLSKLDRQELTQILTDAFLTRQKLDIPTTTVKEGVDFVFEQNPELTNIGTKEQYSNYLDTVFPNSMVKQIMYHGSPIGKISEIDKRFAITYWSTSIDYVRSSNLWKGNITTALLDIRNPLFTNKPLASAPPEVTEFLSPGYTPETYDSVIGVDAGQELVGGRTIAVKNQKADTHILGSKKDIEGFKKYVQGKTQGSGMTKLLDLIGMKRWTQTKNNCPKL